MKISLSLILVVQLFLLISSRTIQWTGAGGNPLWNFANNWDCLCVPGSGDDVIVNSPIVASTVTISTPSSANSLTIGGTSPFTQTLTLLSSLSLGPGGGSIGANGFFYVNTALNQAFSSAGQFNAGSNLIFMSGTLQGLINFVNVNCTGAAAKSINATVTVSGNLYVELMSGGQGELDVETGSLTVSGQLQVQQSLTIRTFPGAILNIGTFDYPGVTGSSINFLGTASIANMNVDREGNLVINNGINVGRASVNGMAQLTLSGADTDARVFTDLRGTGTVNIKGGSNTFHGMSNIETISISGGTLIADQMVCNIGSFDQSGGFIQGTGTLSIGMADLENSNIASATVNVGILSVDGFVTLTNNAFVNVQNSFIVSASSHITMETGANFGISNSGSVTQNFPLDIVASGTSSPPGFVNNGRWMSTSTLNLNVPSRGSGSYNFTSGAKLTVSGSTFATPSLTLVSATYTAVGSINVITNIFGSGSTINAQSVDLRVTGRVNILNFNQINGQSQIASGSIGALVITGGNFNATGPGVQVTTLNLQEGELSSVGLANTIQVGQLMITGTVTKSIFDVTVKCKSFSFSCGGTTCPVIYQNALITTAN